MRFRKMHGLGNDFVVVDATRAPVEIPLSRLAELADRHRGIGFDQWLVLEPGASRGEFGYRIFNADASPAEQCGNGLRCLARYAFERGYASGDAVRFGNGETTQEARLAPGDLISVDMGRPVLEPSRIPFAAAAQAASYPLEVNGLRLTIGAVSMGNPHAVLRVEDIAAAPVAELGPAIEHHPAFPQRANVGFLEVSAPSRVRLRVWERGTGETLACGTGACAAMVWGRLMNWLEPLVEVELPGGVLELRWPGVESSIWATGPAVTVFEGELRDA
ncbi:MAG TPA: diaminopimelate epimerase [Gammaproteobacteria bacterium]|nr:diaminopimelate epimerase [Gammaproteobacteria bacterium]